MIWVFRDFTLQLQDGPNFSAICYLEKVLNYNKRSSENIQFNPNSNSDIQISDSLQQQNSEELVKTNKESVRQIIKYYFKQRECLTIVRSTYSEIDLQNLDSL